MNTTPDLEAAYRHMQCCRELLKCKEDETLLDAIESLRVRVQELDKTKRCPKCGYDGPMPFHSCVVNDRTEEVQKVFDEWMNMRGTPMTELNARDFANSLLKAAGVKERVK